MSDIVKFLTARIAEDEAPSWTLTPYSCPPGHCAPQGWVGVECHICGDGVIYGGTVAAMTESAEERADRMHLRPRILAECEAKRAIIERYGPTVARIGGEEHLRFEEYLWLLASPYADHPDYDPAWATA